MGLPERSARVVGPQQLLQVLLGVSDLVQFLARWHIRVVQFGANLSHMGTCDILLELLLLER